MTGPLHAGENVIRFENAGPQEHDVQLVRLDSLVTLDSIRRWAGAGGMGAPTTRIAGGASGIAPGRRVWFSTLLRPGRYALFCFVPDEHDGRLHVLHGMLRELVVQ